MGKWIAEFDLDGGTMPEHMDLHYMGGKIDFHCRPMWIPVSERLPEKYTCTLWCSLGGCVKSDYFNGEFWEYAEKYGYEVIAWMPLPQPYKVESEDKI